MAELTKKIRTTQSGYAHWCPGCQEMHILPNRQPGWTYSDMDTAPTATPSFLHSWTERREGKVCHYILTAGVLNYCGDCTHELSGKMVPLPDIPTNEMLGMPGCE